MFRKAILSLAALVVSCGMAFAQYNPNTFAAPKAIDNHASPYPNLNYVTPQMFGAVCNGSQDDAIPLQAAENAAFANKSAVAFLGPNMCRTTVAITPKPGVDHFCFSGMNEANGAPANRCGVTSNASWAYDMPTAALGSSVMAPTFHDMQIISNGGGIRLGTIGAGSSQATASYFKVDRVTFSTAAGNDSIQATLCFYCKIDQSWFITPVRFYMSDYVTISNSSFQNQFTNDNRPLIQLFSDNTFGNGNLVDHNFFECPQIGTACLATNAQSVTITNNGFECGSSSPTLDAVIQITAPTSQGAFSNYINNNTISCAATQVGHWLVVNNTNYLYNLTATNNTCSCLMAAAIWSPQFAPIYVPGTTSKSQIFHSGNSNEKGFPFSSYSNSPKPEGSITNGLLYSVNPGADTYNFPRNGSAFSAVATASNGSYVIPAAGSGGSTLIFDDVPSNFVGTLDICILASTAVASQTIKIVSSDGGTPINTSTFSPTSNPTWYCYKGHAFTLGATAAIVNDDTVHNGTVFVYQLTISQEL